MFAFLKQSTASQARILGPFVDDTDFKTLETALTIANTDVKLSKNGAAAVNKNLGGGTHIINGCYALTFDATDTNTVGELHVSISVAGALVVVAKFWILEEAIYDSLIGASAAGFDANQRMDVGKWLGTAPNALVTGRVDSEVPAAGFAQAAADKVWSTATRTLTAFSTALAVSVWDVLESAIATASSIGLKVKNNLDAAISTRSSHGDPDPSGFIDAAISSRATPAQVNTEVDAALDTAIPASPTGGSINEAIRNAKEALSIRRATAQAGAATSITLDAGASALNDFYNNSYVVIVGGTGIGQARFVSDYDGTTKVATVNAAWITNPDATSFFLIVPFSIIPGASAPTAAEVADAVWDEVRGGHVGAGSFGEGVKAESLNAQAKADVNAEALDVLNVDTFTEPGQEAPPVTASLVKKIGYLYKFLRNRITSSSTEIKVFNDDATTVAHKSTHSDDGSTYDRGEFGTGP